MKNRREVEQYKKNIGIMCIKKKNITLHKMKVIGHYGIHKNVDFN